ncbi:hypothetical protein [Bordetella sp. LUAb4]|uniref:hypothetical protein n=1 Tax=Bordetella sp. LUAb4 TaxID=2843195 RepID=UPI001E3E13EA|nr:hypothetical protein [Bordetella sp. LUAb4]
MDDYVHDSRAWFRVPYFHEYAPGGFAWGRTFFVGGDIRVRDLGFDRVDVDAVTLRRQEASTDRQKFEVVHKTPKPLAPVAGDVWFPLF